MVVIGCGKNSGSAKPALPPPKPVTREVQTEGGSVTRRDTETKKVLWTVEWQTATLEYTDDNRFGGMMQDVKGTIYQDGQPASDFSAQAAVASKENSTLELKGEVTVTSRDPQGQLFCGKVVYNGQIERVEALENVRAETSSLEVGPFPRVYARPDLSLIATPDLYEESK